MTTKNTEYVKEQFAEQICFIYWKNAM